ncbi:DUF1298 domain-containing protein [Pseudohalioglobus sediminis]|uniref:diacylglycerol O-acyltransferase n=1 Tax=Pseudohalioglobus sediminis TaxID=2606449 RepID=A0A5B0WY36_9GAMM|nr:wax ester/triacylglycerol synthase domain-containing protein [Pseudohalioglobus sediminis]KAA1191933.1 DUF1298 domain-containing protein [Pseudohalioglobus sediminis]
MYQLDGLDNIMLQGEVPGLPMHMSAAMLYDSAGSRTGAINFDKLVNALTDIIDQHFPILKCKADTVPLWFDKAYWVLDEDFDLTAQMSRIALPAPADWQEFYMLLGRFHATRLPQDKPLWQIVQVEGLDALEGIPPGSTALFLKIHHSVMDGTSAIRLMRGLHSTGPRSKPSILKSAPGTADSIQETYSAPSLLDKYARGWRHALTRPVLRTGTLLKTLPGLVQPRRAGSKGKKRVVPRSRFNQAVSANRVVGHMRMDMAALRRLEKAYDCTINDLALCVVGGAQRQYLLDNNELPEQSLVAAMPINIRKQQKDGEIGTRVTVARVPLFTEMDDMETRLQAIVSETRGDKRDSKSSSARVPLNIIDEIHPAAILLLTRQLYYSGYLDTLPPVVNMTVSNVPGFAEETYLLGSRLIDYLGFGPLGPGLGLFQTISSTPGHVNISFTSTTEIVGDGVAYRRALQQSYEQLLSDLPA